jgi:hypothetical protein
MRRAGSGGNYNDNGRTTENITMHVSTWVIAIIAIAIVIGVGLTIRDLIRRSRKLWKNLDCSKLRKWDDDDWN